MNSTKEEILLNFFHEMSNLIDTISKNSDVLGMSTKKKIDTQAIQFHVGTIQETIELIRFQISLVNLELNPKFFELQQTKSVNIHATFSRAVHIFRQRSKKSKVKILIEKSNELVAPIEVHPIANIIPYIILDNAMKYSPTNSNVYVSIQEVSKSLIISIDSIGPKVDSDEIKLLTNMGYRGKRVIENNFDGSGIGLFYLKNICNLCSAHLRIESNQNSYNLNGVEYSNFKVEIELNS